jgi:glycerophosphoryl diester phosphodiesterase
MRIIAHRGASARAPENTLAAFALARRLGAHAVELDARICGSGEAVVFHDETLEALTGAPGRVAETPLAVLRSLKVKGAEPIPLLEEVLDAADRPGGVVIEMKTDAWWRRPAIAARVAEAIRRTDAGARGPIVVSSFHPGALMALRRIAPQHPRALLAHAGQALPLRRCWLAGYVHARELHLEACMITARTLERARRAGRFVVAWTVNERAEEERLRALGVDGIITDHPELFVEPEAPPARADAGASTPAPPVAPQTPPRGST